MAIIYNGEKDERMYKQALATLIGDHLEKDERVIYLDADLMNCIGTGALPAKTNRAIDCGVSEANMIGVACGTSAVGFNPIVHSFGPFASRRVFDQIFLSGGYAKNNITVIGSDPGIAAALNGGTHMPFEDTALYRTIPGAVISDITDITMLNAFMDAALKTKGVKYIRVGRKVSYPVYSEDTEFEFGKGFVLREGTDLVIVACGIMVHEAMQAAIKLEEKGISAAVIDPYTVKPLDKELIRSYTEKTGKIIVAENHNKIGGLVSAVQDAIVGLACGFGYVAVEDEFGEVGPVDYLRERYDLTDTHIIREAERLMA